MNHKHLSAWLFGLATCLICSQVGLAEDLVAPPHPLVNSKWHGAYVSYDNEMVYADVTLSGDTGKYVAYSDYSKRHKVGWAQLCHVTAVPRPDGTVLISGSWIWGSEPHVCGPFAWVCKGDSFKGVWSVSPSFKEFPVDSKTRYAWFGHKYAQVGDGAAPAAPPVELPRTPPQQPPLDAFQQGQPAASGGQPAAPTATPQDPPPAQSSPPPQGPLVQKSPAAAPAATPNPTENAPAASPAPDNSLTANAPARQEVDQFVQGLTN